MLEKQFTKWVGSKWSLVFHTIFFIGCFSLVFFGFDLDTVLLFLTTVVSLEAIYLAIFIQMTVNKNTESLAEVEEDIEEIHDEVGEISHDVEEISEEIDEIAADVDEIADSQDENKSVDEEKDNNKKSLEKIEKSLVSLLEEISKIKNEKV